MSPKVETNRQNAQSSTGPRTEEGKQRSSLNAVKHGFTGQTLILSPEEKEAYEFHVLALTEQYKPANHEESDLLQQYIDLRWTLHQISVQQSNVFAILNAVTQRHMREGTVDDLPAATAPHYKTLHTLAIYEQRRRRAAESTLAALKALIAARLEAAALDLAQATAAYKSLKAQGKPFNPTEFGFVCSTAQIEQKIARETLLQTARAAAQSA